MTHNTIRLSLAIVEVNHLAGLIEEFIDLLATFDGEPDPGLIRLTPDAYPDDADASAGFSAATRDDLLDRRTADAAVVRGGLTPFLSTAADELAGNEAFAPREVIVPTSDIDAWLRTLTALRLVIATRLGIAADEDEHDPEDPRFGVYDWLGFRLDGLITLADAQDASFS